jgi:hypothetical protein
VLVTEIPVRTVVYERTKWVSVAVKPASALTDNMPSTVVAITVVYLEFWLDIKDALGGPGKMVVEPFRGGEPGTEANDVAIPLAVYADVGAILASSWMLNNSGDGELALSVVAVL